MDYLQPIDLEDEKTVSSWRAALHGGAGGAPQPFGRPPLTLAGGPLSGCRIQDPAARCRVGPRPGEQRKNPGVPAGAVSYSLGGGER